MEKLKLFESLFRKNPADRNLKTDREMANAIIDTLTSIDFAGSKLPREVLESRSSESQPCSDLEYAARVLIGKLKTDSQPLQVDIRPIDDKLMTLTLLFKQAVEQGDDRAAYAAKGGLIRGVNDIRCRIPQNQPEIAKRFVEDNARYLNQWITLVDLAQVADRMKQNLESERERLRSMEDEYGAFRDQIQNDLELNNACHDLMSKTFPPALWTPAHHKAHEIITHCARCRKEMAYIGKLIDHHQSDLNAKVHTVEALYCRLAAFPITNIPEMYKMFFQND